MTDKKQQNDQNEKDEQDVREKNISDLDAPKAAVKRVKRGAFSTVYVDSIQ